MCNVVAMHANWKTVHVILAHGAIARMVRQPRRIAPSISPELVEPFLAVAETPKKDLIKFLGLLRVKTVDELVGQHQRHNARGDTSSTSLFDGKLDRVGRHI